MPFLCVYCASSPYIPERYVELAAQVGSTIAARGWGLVSGGGTQSMMGAVARATRAGGGPTIGVIPQALVDYEVADHDAQELIVTTDMRERKGIMDARADAFLCLPGGIGTLEELMEVWTSRHLRMHDKPVVVLDPWEDFALLREQVKHWRDMGFVHEHAVEQLVWTKSIDEAFAALGIPELN
ncbi:MAG: TIGR00730 family Rossman fold protein [Actinobacteria bacterium]|nr:TIGR00730 family Rossman fold protein [Actinomycetota bacterium]MSZ41546.1 TIGR00730 family Rossman fold protein [Actinomycetota bacterium]